MRTIISNNIKIYDPTPFLVAWVNTNLVVTNPKYATLIRLGKNNEIKHYHIPEKMNLFTQTPSCLVLPFGCLNSIWHMIKDFYYEINFNKAGDISCKNDKITLPLYDYQEDAVNKMVLAKGGVLQGSCACGKTNMGIEIVHRVGKRFLWLCHTKDLLKQSLERFKLLYPNMKVGTITEGKIDMGKDGTIATIQTMVNIDPYLYANEFDLVICDEVHHVSGSPTLSKQFIKVIEKIPARYKYGLTATPSRGDTLIKSMYTTIGTNLNGEFEPVCKIDRNDTKVLTATHEMFTVQTPFSYEMLNDDGTFNYNGLIDYLSFNDERNEQIINNVVNCAQQDRKQIILCHRVEHCKLLHSKLLECGLKSTLLVGNVSSKKREEILLEKIEWDVIVATYSLAKEGLDVKSLDTLHMTTPQKDKAMVVQCVGRIERIKEGKKDPIAYDYVDVNIPYCLSAYKKRKAYINKRY